ncbi:Csu type fimbrial protein [Chitinibacter tainanensis]|uniref:Csu type fimbrial protein n=1 Tax=Chitinibacter tainanensis TaxID=230667 RepID=UPI0004216994|nr:spore coat U domain-containing protein [Chitinibacter tainanensis]
MSKQWSAFALAACLGFPGASWAMSCSISSLPIGDMGVYFPDIDITRQYAIFLTCTSGGAIASLSAGPSQNTGSIENRRMKHDSRSDTLRYQLCLDGACSTIFGNSGNQIGTIMITDQNQGRFSFWVKVFGGQPLVAAGTYRDTVTITLSP